MIDLDEIKARHKAAVAFPFLEYPTPAAAKAAKYGVVFESWVDVPDLVAEVERLRAALRVVAAQTSPDMAMIECARLARAALGDAP